MLKYYFIRANNISDSAISHYECGIRRINIEQVLVLVKMYETVEERTSPYWGGYRDYQRALHGEE